jgi:indole-3-glycerol phosphate synthase
MTGVPDLLEAIVASTRTRVAWAMEREPRAALERRAAARTPNGPLFAERLSRTHTVNVIAECKRRSPSRGVLRAGYDPVAIAAGYERAGAAAISVLTEPGFFDGSLEHLEAVRAAVEIPLLRKDFIVDEYQLLEARAAGADAVLLIVAALDDDTLGRLFRAAADLGLAALIEVHDVAECRRLTAALHLAPGTWHPAPSTQHPAPSTRHEARGTRHVIVGVNNRNLRTLHVDLNASRDVAAVLPEGAIGVSESGLKTSADLRAMTALGYRAFLMGERFMVDPDPGAALAELLGSLAYAHGAQNGGGQ